MADQITTITESELLEFGRLATTYAKHRDDFEIHEKDLPGCQGITRIEVRYEPNHICREYERTEGSSWLGWFGEDLANGRFDVKTARMKKGRPKTASLRVAKR